jgi:hypothetical protein
VLDFYQKYQNATNSVVSTGASIYYPTGLEGVIVYNTIKGQLSTDTTANASVTYAVPLGGVNASASGEATFVDSSSAYLFHALVRQVTWAKLPKLADALADLNKMGKNLISATNTNNKVAAYDSTSNRIKASFVMEGMPSTLCSPNVWKVSTPVPSDLSLSSQYLSSSDQVKAATGSVATSSDTHPRSAYIRTVSTGQEADNADITGALSLILDSNSALTSIAFDFPYSVALPVLKTHDSGGS